MPTILPRSPPDRSFYFLGEDVLNIMQKLGVHADFSYSCGEDLPDPCFVANRWDTAQEFAEAFKDILEEATAMRFWEECDTFTENIIAARARGHAPQAPPGPGP